VAADDPSTFFVDQRRVVIVRRDIMVPEGGQPIAVTVPQPGRLPRPVEQIPAVVTLSNGEKLVADRNQKAVIRYSPQVKYVGSFLTTTNAERIVRSGVDDVAIYDRDSKTIIVTDRDARPLGRIPMKGPNYQMNEVRDLAYDTLGHLYVLDRDKPVIHVFGPRNRLVTSITGVLQRPRAFGVDHAGRLLVFDEGVRRIQVLQ
jgi:hypothetical protein